MEVRRIPRCWEIDLGLYLSIPSPGKDRVFVKERLPEVLGRR
jgi:hypothetical protein